MIWQAAVQGGIHMIGGDLGPACALPIISSLLPQSLVPVSSPSHAQVVSQEIHFRNPETAPGQIPSRRGGRVASRPRGRHMGESGSPGASYRSTSTPTTPSGRTGSRLLRASRPRTRRRMIGPHVTPSWLCFARVRISAAVPSYVHPTMYSYDDIVLRCTATRTRLYCRERS